MAFDPEAMEAFKGRVVRIQDEYEIGEGTAPFAFAAGIALTDGKTGTLLDFRAPIFFTGKHPQYTASRGLKASKAVEEGKLSKEEFEARVERGEYKESPDPYGMVYDDAAGSYAVLTAVTNNFEAEDANGATPLTQEGLQRALGDEFFAFLSKDLHEIDNHPNVTALLKLGKFARGTADRFGRKGEVVVARVKDKDAPVQNALDAWLRLYLLSARRVAPNGLSQDGIFGKLNNIVWTSQGPFLPNQADEAIFDLGIQGTPASVSGEDKFPNLLDYFVPSGVRISDSNSARLGAHLGRGTVVMPSGFVNFNAGTLGEAMIEGRVSNKVAVGEGTDLGGGSSTMGTLSGGGEHVITIGERCLIGANGGTGISLGDDCVIGSGVYVAADRAVLLPTNGETVKASQLSGGSNMKFVIGSKSGLLEVRKNKTDGSWGELNPLLHS